MKMLMTGFIFVFLLAAVPPAAGYSNPVEGGISETVTTAWDAGFQLTVGKATANNTLSVTNGGTVFDGVGVVGELSGADGNSVLVSGSGSAWTTVSDLVIGNDGSFNTMLIQDGGTVSNANAIIGMEEGAANNSVEVNGINSVWNSSDTLMVGRKGDGNSLVISGGGVVNSHFGAIGFETPAGGNTVEVSGAGSIWNNSGDLLIGTTINSGNSLAIQDGGKVVVGGQLSIYNDLYLNENGWLKIDGHADLESGDRFHYQAGSTLEVTGSVWFDGRVADHNTLIFQGEEVDWLSSSLSHKLYIGDAGGDNSVIISNRAVISTMDTRVDNNSNRIVVTGPGSSFSVSSNLYLGVTGSDNELLVLDGATVSVTTGYVGYTASADHNRIGVEGAGSVFSNSAAMYIGYDGGEQNRFEVLNGGTASLGVTHIGYTNTLNNSIGVDGSNSVLSAAELHIGGSQTRFNTFTVINGAQAAAGTSTIGSGTNSISNSAWVSGDGSFWDAGALTIGTEMSSNNTLTIENGGKVSVNTLEIFATNSNGNALYLNEGSWLKVQSDMDAGMEGFNWAALSTLEVQGSITNLNGRHDGVNTLILSKSGIWSNDYEVAVGYSNSMNRLRLVDGGVIANGDGYIGRLSNSDANWVEISGPGSVWSNSSKFIVGAYGSDNLLIITNQGAVSSGDDMLIGADVGADRNAITVHGAGSRLYTRFGALVVGYAGLSNTVSALNGGLITSGSGLIGLDSDHNQVLIDGAGSKWSMNSSLRVGIYGANNTLTVSDGGVASVAGSSYVGYLTGSDGNTLTVEGDNSRLSSALTMHVGHQGSGNELNILSAGRVFDDIGLVGTDNGADRNRVLIDGVGSLWYHRHTFFAGNSGSSNTVAVQNGAQLFNTTGYIGYHTNAYGNRVVVDQASWDNTDGLFVGFNGSGNSMVITNGATVTSGESRIGAEGSAHNNQVLVTGDGSVWNIGKSLWVGNNSASNNTLVVENGGKVIVDENISVGLYNGLYINDGGTVSVYGDTLFTAGFNVGAGGTFETFGGVSGIGGTLESGRTLRLSGAGASWNEPGHILLESGSMLDIGAGAAVSTPSNFTQQAAATLRFGMATNSAGAPVSGRLNVAQVADFAGGANLVYASDIGNLSFDKTYTNTLVSAGTLVVGGQTNAATADLARYLNTVGTLVGISLVVEEQDILAIVNRIGLSGGLNPADEDLRAVLEEIDARATAGDPLANRQLEIINSMTPEQANAQLAQFYTRGLPTYQHMDGVLQGLRHIEKRTSEMLMETAYYVKPIGAYGPAADGGAWRGWVSAYGNNGVREASRGLSGYDVGTYGTVLGVDKSFNNMVVGLSGGLAGSAIDQEDGDASDASTAYGALYATVRLKDVDFDLIGSYGSSSIESSSGTIFGSDAETDASTMVFYIGASEEAVSGSFTFEPVAALQAAYFSQDGYDEVSNNAIGRSIESYDRWSYKSILGVNVGNVKPLKKFDLVTRLKACWQHEFNTDADRLDYTLIGGTDPHYFTIQAPVEDAFDLGISIGALFGEKFEVSLGLDGLYAAEYTAISYNGRLEYSF